MMWPFRRKPCPPPPQADWGPMETLFSCYVLSVIDHLPPEKEHVIASMTAKLAAALKTSASDWKGVVAEALHLSDTIDYAILDLWQRNSEIARDAGTKLAPDEFASMFVVEYKKDGSMIDVWPGDSLNQAKARIAARHT